VVTFVAQNAVLWDVHVVVRPEMKMSARIIKMAVSDACRWIARVRGAKKFVMHIPEFNKRAMAMAAAGGMVRVGVLQNAFLKKGELHNLVIYQSTDEEFCRLMGR